MWGRTRAAGPFFLLLLVPNAAFSGIYRSINYQKQLDGKKHFTLFLLRPQPG
jgi:hypothetical protein